MFEVALVVYPGFELLDVSGPISVFYGANCALVRHGRPVAYKLMLASSQGGPVESSCGVVLETEPVATFGGGATATFLVAGAEREPLLAALADSGLRDELTRLAGATGRLGSVCTGGFILAALGLFNGRRVATHWDACRQFARAFPRIQVDAEALYVVDGAIWTSAGVSTGVDMALAMVAQDCQPAIADEVARRLVLYARRPGFQSQFSPILQAQSHGDGSFSELVGWIEANLDADLDVTTLAARAGLSERSFHRKFSKATGVTPARFVETARLDAARMLLISGLPMKSIAAQVGLFPQQRFANAFERHFGMSPRLFRELHQPVIPP